MVSTCIQMQVLIHVRGWCIWRKRCWTGSRS
nr:MAG TPA: hypothetical protein [Caudoviricetes sp.]